jgi:hypothetical protein
MHRIRVKVAGRDEHHMLQEIVESAVSLDGQMDVVASEAPADAPDVLLVPADREARETLRGGGEVVALDRRSDYLNLYVLRLFDRVRGSAQLATAIRRLARRVVRERS